MSWRRRGMPVPSAALIQVMSAAGINSARAIWFCWFNRFEGFTWSTLLARIRYGRRCDFSQCSI